MRTWFTFGDGALRYDCARCGQHCCRGKGIALGASELVPLLARRPQLAAHLRVERGGSFFAVDVTDACWFLRTDGNCAVEVEDGRALKPSTCRLFPFNRVFRVGDVRVVDMNSVLCPLEAAPSLSEGVRHAPLLEEIESFAGSPLIDVPAPLPPELPEDWLTLEERAQAAAGEHAKDADALVTALGDPVAATLVPRWSSLFGVDAAQLAGLEEEVAPRVALLAASLRWNRVFARRAAPYPLAVATLPRRLRALSFLGALGRRTSIHARSPSLRGLTELWRDQAAMLDVLERWDTVVKLTAPRFDADVPDILQGALGAILGAAFRGGRTLGELVLLGAATLPEPQRPLALALAAAQLPSLLGA